MCVERLAALKLLELRPSICHVSEPRCDCLLLAAIAAVQHHAKLPNGMSANGRSRHSIQPPVLWLGRVLAEMKAVLMRILTDRSLPRRPWQTSSDNDCRQEMPGAPKADKLNRLLRSALVTSCTGDEGRNVTNHAAPGLIFRVSQG